MITQSRALHPTSIVARRSIGAPWNKGLSLFRRADLLITCHPNAMTSAQLALSPSVLAPFASRTDRPCPGIHLVCRAERSRCLKPIGSPHPDTCGVKRFNGFVLKLFKELTDLERSPPSAVSLLSSPEQSTPAGQARAARPRYIHWTASALWPGTLKNPSVSSVQGNPL